MLHNFKKGLILTCAILMIACSSKKENPNPNPEPIEPTPVKEEQYYTRKEIFTGGVDGYHSFRIPALIRGKAGRLIAFAEGRKLNNRDFGDIDLVYKYSDDNSKNWSTLRTVVSEGGGTWGNPTAVYDSTVGNNGRIWLFLSWNAEEHTSNGSIKKWGDRKVFSTHSDDNGLTWSTPEDKTNSLLPPNYTWDAIGPGNGIQTAYSNTGRLIIPANGRNIYSDDHGATWKYKLLPGGTNEGTIVELVNGGLMRNDRANTNVWEKEEQNKRRWVSFGKIEVIFSDYTPVNALIDPKSQGAMIRYSTENPRRILFLNSASTTTRGNMLVRISYDEGRNWPIDRRLYDELSEPQAQTQGKGGYSSLAKMYNGHIGALVEINENTKDNANSHRSIDFHEFNIAWIVKDQKEPKN